MRGMLTERLDDPDPLMRRHAAAVLATSSKEPEPEPPAVPLAESIRLMKMARLCPYRSRPAGCGCSGSWCGISQALKSDAECWNCLDLYGVG